MQAITTGTFVTVCDLAASVLCVAVVGFDQPHKHGPIKQQHNRCAARCLGWNDLSGGAEALQQQLYGKDSLPALWLQGALGAKNYCLKHIACCIFPRKPTGVRFVVMVGNLLCEAQEPISRARVACCPT